MDLALNGKTTFFTGGSRKIGREIAAMLGREGVNVGIAGRGLDAAEDAARGIRRQGGIAQALPEALFRGIDQ